MTTLRVKRLLTKSSLNTRANIYFKLCVAISKEKALQKYPELTQDIEFFTQRAPSNNLKYLEWQLKILQSKQAPASEIADVTAMFHKYNQLLDNKDINSYKSHNFTELRNKLFDIKEEREAAEEKRKRYSVDPQQVACGHKVVFEDDTYKVLLITNKASSIHFGRDTQWCITMKDMSYFEDYDSNNVIFFFAINKKLDRTSPLSKMALSYERDRQNNIIRLTIFDARDKMIDPFLEDDIADYDLQHIFDLTRDIAKQQPKSLLSKITSNEIPSEKIFELYKQEKDPNIKYIMSSSLANDKNIDPEILRFLYDNEPDNAYLLSNPKMPLDLLIRSLDNDKDRIAAANNPSIPFDALLKHIDEPNVAIAIAKRPEASPDILLRLAKIPRAGEWLIRNLKTPPEAIAIIADRLNKSGYNEFFFNNLIKHPNFSYKLLYQFIDGQYDATKKLSNLTGKDYEEFVNNCRHKNIPLSMAFDILNNPKSDPVKLHYIRRYVARNSDDEKSLNDLLKLTDDDFINGKRGRESLIDAFSENKNLPESILEKLVLLNPIPFTSYHELTDDIIKLMLSSDKTSNNIHVLMRLLENRFLSPNAIRNVYYKLIPLVEHGHDYIVMFKNVFKILSNNRNTPEDDLQLAEKYKNMKFY